MFSDERTATRDNYKNLANAIIQKACEDYVAAVKYWRKYNDNYTKLKIDMLERFFRGQEFLLYTDGNIDPEYMIKMLRQKARER